MIIPLEIGKSSHKALIANYFGHILQAPFEFHNSYEGVRFLQNNILHISKKQPIEKIIIGMEATGHYFKKTAAHLNNMGYDNLFILNPLSTSYCRKAGLTWSKTDDIDLSAVGQSLISGYGNPYHPEAPLWTDLKEACRYRRLLVKHQTSLKNKLHSLFDLLLPGINQLTLFKDTYLWNPASLDFFIKYPNINAIVQLQPKSIIKFFQRRNRRISSEMASQLLTWAKKGLLPYPEANTSREFILKELIDQLIYLSKKIQQIEINLCGYLVQTPAILLLSINYVGIIRAAEFAGEIAPLEQYPKSRALVKAAGLDSTRYQSAASESSKRPVSNKGSRKLRYITIDTADALMKHNLYFASIAKELMAKGKSKGCACVATATRFIRIAFHMINNQQLFKPPNGLGVSENPSDKIKAFLQARQASHFIEQYLTYSKKYLKKRGTLLCNT